MRIAILLITILTSLCTWGEEAEGPQKDRVGPGKAVVAADEKTGIQLSEKALKTLELSFTEARSTSVVVPRSALVQFQDFSAIYRLRNGWFKMIEVEPTFHNGEAVLNSKDLSPGDKIVTENSGLLRVVELDVFGPEADACAD